MFIKIFTPVIINKQYIKNKLNSEKYLLDFYFVNNNEVWYIIRII